MFASVTESKPENNMESRLALFMYRLYMQGDLMICDYLFKIFWLFFTNKMIWQVL